MARFRRHWRLLAESVILLALAVDLRLLQARGAGATPADRAVIGTCAVLTAALLAGILLHRALRACHEGRWRLARGWREWLEIEALRPLPGWPRLAAVGNLAVLAGVLRGLQWVWSPLTGPACWADSPESLPRAVDALLAALLLLAAADLAGATIERLLRDREGADPGARGAVLALAQYAGYAAAALVGLDVFCGGLTQVAVVAGALSVGVGFGLRNVVDNFVCGLILLFERPARVGDWVKVGASEGRVSRVSIRSTTVTTAAGAEVIVPNSEFITQHVVNESRLAGGGRLELTVRVAADADPAVVRDLLLAAARAHTDVSGEPNVQFRSAYDTGLEFALVCRVADLSQRPRVLSDLHFAVDAALRQRGILRGH
jgi:small-conductance mechanosensitive channel